MQKINSAEDLKKSIQDLELEIAIQGKLLREQAFSAYNITSSSYLLNNLFSSLLGVIGGVISKESSNEKSDNPIKNLFKNILKHGITNFIVQHPVAIKLVGGFLMQSLLKKVKSIISKRDK